MEAPHSINDPMGWVLSWGWIIGRYSPEHQAKDTYRKRIKEREARKGIWPGSSDNHGCLVSILHISAWMLGLFCDVGGRMVNRKINWLWRALIGIEIYWKL